MVARMAWRRLCAEGMACSSSVVASARRTSTASSAASWRVPPSEPSARCGNLQTTAACGIRTMARRSCQPGGGAKRRPPSSAPVRSCPAPDTTLLLRRMTRACSDATDRDKHIPKHRQPKRRGRDHSDHGKNTTLGTNRFFDAIPAGSLGRVFELGAGPLTQTWEILNRRPDVRVAEVVLEDPGIPGCLPPHVEPQTSCRVNPHAGPVAPQTSATTSRATPQGRSSASR